MAGVGLSCVCGITGVSDGFVLAGASQAFSWVQDWADWWLHWLLLAAFHINSRLRAEPAGCAMCGSASHSLP